MAEYIQQPPTAPSTTFSLTFLPLMPSPLLLTEAETFLFALEAIGVEKFAFNLAPPLAPIPFPPYL